MEILACMWSVLSTCEVLTALIGSPSSFQLLAGGGGARNEVDQHPHNSCMNYPHCRALKTKHDTPKYGLIYHASLVGQTAPKNKGKISRMLAAKTSLCARVDALGEDVKPTLGIYSRAKVEERLQECEQAKVGC